MMKQNVGSIDKVVRIVLALAIFLAGYYYQSWWGLVGLIPLVTALVSWCPAYTLFGIRTCRARVETSS